MDALLLLLLKNTSELKVYILINCNCFPVKSSFESALQSHQVLQMESNSEGGRESIVVSIVALKKEVSSEPLKYTTPTWSPGTQNKGLFHGILWLILTLKSTSGKTELPAVAMHPHSLFFLILVSLSPIFVAIL